MGLTAEESYDGRALYVARPFQAGRRLWRVTLDGGEPAPGERRLITTVRNSEPLDLMLVDPPAMPPSP